MLHMVKNFTPLLFASHHSFSSLITPPYLLITPFHLPIISFVSHRSFSSSITPLHLLITSFHHPSLLFVSHHSSLSSHHSFHFPSLLFIFPPILFVSYHFSSSPSCPISPFCFLSLLPFISYYFPLLHCYSFIY